MDWRKVEGFLSSGQAFVPMNAKDQGDSVQLYLKDGSTELLNMQCETFLNKLLHHFGLVKPLNKKGGKIKTYQQLGYKPTTVVNDIISYAKGQPLDGHGISNFNNYVDYNKLSPLKWFKYRLNEDPCG